MLKQLAKISKLLSTYTPLVVILAACVAAIWPQSFAWVQQGQRPNVILGIIMLTMGCTLSTEDFKILLRRPTDILLGTIAQFTVMPFVAFGLSKLFGLNPYLSAGIILVGCCPGGVSSNIMSFLCRGDVAFSVGMTTVSTLLAPIVTPLMVLLLAGQEIEVDALGMFKNICIVTLLPVAIGVLFNYVGSKSAAKHTALSTQHTAQNTTHHTSHTTQNSSHWFEQTKSILPGISVLSLACIVGGVIFTVSPRLHESGLSLLFLTLCVVTLHNGLGYLLGYTFGRLAGFNTAKKRTISIEVGMQNAGMATVLANGFFATPAAIAANPLAALTVVPCAISCAYHSISGTILASWFRSRDNA